VPERVKAPAMGSFLGTPSIGHPQTPSIMEEEGGLQKMERTVYKPFQKAPRRSKKGGTRNHQKREMIQEKKKRERAGVALCGCIVRLIYGKGTCPLLRAGISTTKKERVR